MLIPRTIARRVSTCIDRLTPVIDKMRNTSDAPRIVVLCYHSVHPDKPFASATPQEFDAHLAWLKTNTQVIPFQNVFAAMEEIHAAHRVAITFDDGYADNYEYAVPLLAKHGLPATFFPITGLIERDPAVLERCRMLQRANLESVRPLEWRHLRDIACAGFEIGAHSHSHPNLKTLNDRAAHLELVRAREILEQKLGRAVRSMAYPFGNPGRHIVPRTTALAASAGYERAAAILYRNVRARDTQFAIPRFTIARDTLARLRAKIYGTWDFLGCYQENHPRWIHNRRTAGSAPASVGMNKSELFNWRA